MNAEFWCSNMNKLSCKNLPSQNMKHRQQERRVIRTTNTSLSSSWMTWQTIAELNSLFVSSFSLMKQTFWRTYCFNVFLLLSEHEGRTCRSRQQGLFSWFHSKENYLFSHILLYLLIHSAVFKISFIYLQDCQATHVSLLFITRCDRLADNPISWNAVRIIRSSRSTMLRAVFICYCIVS